MVITIAYFDRYIDESYLTKITKCKVISKVPCFSNEIRLRKIRNNYITFHTKDYHSSITDYSYGMLYELEIEDLDLFKLYHSFNLNIKKINVTTIKVDSVEDFMRNRFETLNQIEVLSFVAKVNDENKRRYKNRRTKVNFNKRLLLNFLKI